MIRKGYADTDFGQLHYRELAGGNGPPVVFFHRTPVASASFEPVMRELAGWRRLIAFDTPGFGESFTPIDGSTMADLIAAFTQALDNLGCDEFHAVGHHSGCHFVAELAAYQSRRVISVMLDGAMVQLPQEPGELGPPPVPTIVDEAGDYARQAWSFIRPYYTVFDGPCMHAEFVGAMASTFTRSASAAIIRQHDMSAALARVTCPILASAAKDDVFIDHLGRILAIRPEATTVVYDKAGIASPELRPTTFALLVRQAVSIYR